jgi:luciferase family oxidoreductase group 1
VLRLSVLDVSPVASGSTAVAAIACSLDLARACDALGYTRYWLAEHHNASGIASSAPEVLVGHIAAVTRRMRVGSGGVMLPNHAPLHVAEAFATLEALHPGRIDLGLGRAPGTDKVAAMALRLAGVRERAESLADARVRLALTADDFPLQLDELLAFLRDDFPAGHPFRRVHVAPKVDVPPPVWLLGSTETSGKLAARLGLGFAFAHHINPTFAVDALREYRAAFQPSTAPGARIEPAAILALSSVSAATHDEADRLARSLDLSWLRSGRGERGPLPTVEEALAYPYDADEQTLVREGRDRHLVGAHADVAARISDLAARAQVDEVMLLTLVHDHQARVASYAGLARALGLPA